MHVPHVQGQPGSDGSDSSTDLSALLSALSVSDTNPNIHSPGASSSGEFVPFQGSSQAQGLFQSSDTSRSIPAHPLASKSKKSKKKKKYYCVTRGRAIGVFDNWPMTHSYVTGINAAFKGYPTNKEALRAFNECRELGGLEIISDST
ncbi:hypothetical protein M378DRAFT_182212 [Amanita muscaria Koide BX008]|uniref:Ribonuclease H1 N-terminal domain-containing protein n=1 Tax=Amanita muscaria (strain Koide BX008) TaxID=946122 RepID=A0A0C2W355_AMAMK|nr:hypothetical protein M378DRAFT_182212 [Amanita muscaria Koide BX008]